MSKRDIAEQYFHDGYNCAQSVLLTYAGEINLDEETVKKLGSSFGAGMGRLRQVCGTVSAMFMIAGMLEGYISPNDDSSKAEHYRLIQELAEEFKKKNGSIVCRELLGIEEVDGSFVPAKRTDEYYAVRPCQSLVGDAAEIIENKFFKEKTSDF